MTRKRTTPREALKQLNRLGISVVGGGQPDQIFVAFAEGELPELVAIAESDGSDAQHLASLRNLAAVMRQAPGARRSETMIDFQGLGRRFATLVPWSVVAESWTGAASSSR